MVKFENILKEEIIKLKARGKNLLPLQIINVIKKLPFLIEII